MKIDRARQARADNKMSNQDIVCGHELLYD